MWFNFIGFQISWLGLVLWGNLFIPIALLWLTIHFIRLSVVQRRQDAQVIFLVALLGICFDSALIWIGVFEFNDNIFNSVFIPMWLMVLWCCFAATLTHSLSFLANLPFLQIACGAIVAPLSYYAGYQLSAVNFGYSISFTLGILAIYWSVLMLIFFQIVLFILTKEQTNVT
ncbi:DUF2878 domain-containing protein [Thalassotalea sp. G2M2-11]|uniref:DUF2878 domain-containing protein n=1 Tax=Thalassotalea sp. G2M2-11 TaxID=2787627 RepID=UPI0019D31F08|nr:DUF2878 domain-containing protein [Thalassotalea sp. G2M2-11]